MTGHVTVVTDSTACLPPELAARWGVRVIDMQLTMGGEVNDETRVPHQQLIDAMRSNMPITTSPPDPAAFFWTYQDVVAQGASAIVSLHISSRQSQTCHAALEGRTKVRAPVHVVDSRTTGMSLGYAVLAAARIARAGGDPQQVTEAAQHRLRGCQELIHVETLDYLRRGGRIGAAQHLIGSALAFKPMLTMRNGQVTALDRSVGSKRAIRKLVDTAARVAGREPVDIAVEYFGHDERAEPLLAQLVERLPNVNEAQLVEVSAIIAAHVGPGTIAVTVSKL